VCYNNNKSDQEIAGRKEVQMTKRLYLNIMPYIEVDVSEGESDESMRQKVANLVDLLEANLTSTDFSLEGVDVQYCKWSAENPDDVEVTDAQDLLTHLDIRG
jgi:hypothetical protein